MKKKLFFLALALFFLIIPLSKAEISVNLTSPIDYYNSSNNSVNFFCNASETNLMNISLYGNWSGAWKINSSNYKYSASLCYQETANETTACGGLATGSYSTNNSDYYLYVNYTKPANATVSSLWHVKHGNTNSNVTLYQSCWDYNATDIILKVGLGASGSASSAYCYNGSWQNLTQSNIPINCGSGWSPYTSYLNFSYDTDYTTKWCVGGICSCLGGLNYYQTVYEEAMWWNLSESNATLTSNVTVTGIPDGIFKWNCESINFTGTSNFSMSNRTFTIDTAKPTMLIDFPANGSYLNYNPYINGTCTDSLSGVSTIWTNLTEYPTLDLTSPFNFTNTTSLTNKGYMINLSCNDSAGNLNSTFFSFTYDNVTPSANYSGYTPANGSTQGNGTLVINVSASDTNPWYAWINSTFGATNTTDTNQSWLSGTNISFAFEGLASGNYTWNTTICDLAGNCNITGTYQINISLSNLSIAVYNPTEGESITSASLPYTLNLTYMFNPVVGQVLDTCQYNVTHSGITDVATTTINCSSGVINYTSVYLSFYVPYTLTIYANQTDGKEKLLERTFTITSSSGEIGPGGGGGGVLTCNNVTQWKIETDRGGISNYLLMTTGDDRITHLKIYNLGISAVQITLSCEEQDSSGICHYVTFANSTVVVPSNSLSPADVPVNINLSNYPSTNLSEFVFTVNANDGTGCVGKVDFIVSKSVLGTFFIFDKAIASALSSFTISLFGKEYQIPHWMIMVLIVSIFFTIGVILQRNKRFEKKNIVLWMFLFSIFIILVYIALLIWLT